MRISCRYCKQEVIVPLYFYYARIVSQRNFMGDEYKLAMVKGKAICPGCGETIDETFQQEISDKDIIRLATGREDIDS